MNKKPQPYCQLQTMSNLLMQIEGSKPVVLRFDDHRYHPIGLAVDGMDYLTILFERNGLNGVAYDVDGYRGSRTWRTSNCYFNGDYEFRQRTEDELCDEVVKEVIETRINCKWIPLATNQHQPIQTMTKSNLPTLAESQGDICYDDEDYDKSFTPQPMENTITTETIKDLSIEIACLLDEPSEVTEQDLIKLQDLITKLDNQ